MLANHQDHNHQEDHHQDHNHQENYHQDTNQGNNNHQCQNKWPPPFGHWNNGRSNWEFKLKQEG